MKIKKPVLKYGSCVIVSLPLNIKFSNFFSNFA